MNRLIRAIRLTWCKRFHTPVYEVWDESPLYYGVWHCPKCKLTTKVVDRE